MMEAERREMHHPIITVLRLIPITYRQILIAKTGNSEMSGKKIPFLEPS
ncbi:MAG: hypothetical protein WB815_02185 [Nitrososphaeraceae archaeon]